VLQVTVLGVGAAMAFRGSLSVGSLASFQALFLTMSYSLGYVTQYVPYVVQAGAGMRRIDELLAETPRIADGPDPVRITSFDALAFEHVTFGYTPERKQLVDATFTLRAGQTVAFVGASGSGKSTVLNLLMRFYDPDSGRVSVDGHDLRAIARQSLREQMGVVFQDSILFDTTIRENIRVGKLDATDAEIEAAARAAEVHEMVAAMPAGYDTLVGERGSRLSGGQRQRIAIARALLRDPRMLLLDEATSALDAATEAAINDTLAHVSRGRTVISVTHRLAAVTALDRICVLDKGALVEDGTHEALVTAGGTYARLWEKQLGFTIGAGEALIQPARLRAIQIFASVDEALLATLTEILVIERHPANRAVFQEGDPGDKLYIISRGRVSVFIGTDDARGELGLLEDGDHFGEIALLEDTVRTASVRTLTECTFLTLPRDAFQRLLERDPKLRTAFESVADARHASATVDRG
jgi:ATP-binding cassette, subfamily B, bacterial